MDPNTADSPQLQLDPAAQPPATPLASPDPAAPPSPPAAEAAAAAAKPPVREGSRASTKARVNAPKPKTGARRRDKAAVEAESVVSDEGRVGVVLKTSRYTGRHGRAVARKTTVLVNVDRGLKLIMLDHAREATKDETAAATVYLD